MVGDLSKVMTGNTAAAANQIQSLDPDGFTIGTNNTVNQNGQTFTWIAFKASAGGMSYGTYSGNGTAGRAISGLDFSPEAVFVFDQGNTAGVFMSAADANCFAFTGGGAVANTITGLAADGFTLGNSNQVNGAGRTYHYVAWNEIAGYMDVGSYTGNGVDNRNIPGVGFQPEWLIVKSRSAGNQVAVTHTEAQGASTDVSLYFTATAAANNRIQALQADGFQVGTNATVNSNTVVYSYMAWAESTTPVNNAPVLDNTQEPDADGAERRLRARRPAPWERWSRAWWTSLRPRGRWTTSRTWTAGRCWASPSRRPTRPTAPGGTPPTTVTNWNALGAVASNNARLLAADANTRLYFQPNANYHGTLATAITFRAWDQTSGSNGTLADTTSNGGTTAFSTATDTASLVINPVADTPSVTNATTNEDTQTTSGLVISRNAGGWRRGDALQDHRHHATARCTRTTARRRSPTARSSRSPKGMPG